MRLLSDLQPDQLFELIKRPEVNVEPAHCTFFVVELLDRIARTQTSETGAAVGAVAVAVAVAVASSMLSLSLLHVNSQSSSSSVMLKQRETAIHLLCEIYRQAGPKFSVDDADNALRVHILRRLRRLCTIPDSLLLVDAAKRELTEAFLHAPPPSCWSSITCMGGSAATSIAERLQKRTGVSSLTTIDNIAPNPSFYDSQTTDSSQSSAIIM